MTATAATESATLTEIAAIERAAAWGRSRAAWARIEPMLTVANDDVRAAACAVAGDVLERLARPDLAAHRFVEAARLGVRTAPAHAGVWLARAVETAIDARSVSHGRELLDASELEAGAVAEFAKAVLALARGDVVDAAGRLQALRPSDGAALVWRNVWRAEALLEARALRGAEEAVVAAQTALPKGERLTLPALRVLQVRAWVAVLSARNAGPLAELRRRSAAHPRSAAFAGQIDAELALANGTTPAWGHALQAFADAGAPGRRDLVRARQLAEERAALRQRTGDEEATLRARLIDGGATGRVAQLAGRAEEASASLMASRRSMTLRLKDGAAGTVGIEAILEVSRQLNQKRRIEELLDDVLASVTTVLKAERAAVVVDKNGALTCIAGRGGIRAEDVRPGSAAVSFGILEEAQRTGEVVASDSAVSDARFEERASVQAASIRGVVCAPIRTSNATYGYLYVDRRNVGTPFSLEDQDLLALFCLQVGTVWENAHAFETIDALNVGLEAKVKERTLELRETNVQLKATLDDLTNTRLRLAEAQRDALEGEMTFARKIQESILPPPTPHQLSGGDDVCGVVVPASFCGGDFWGMCAADNGTFVVISDVTGHGVAAALLTASMRACLDTAAQIGGERSPARVLALMNDVVRGAGGGALFATACCVFVPSAGGPLRYANAGHPFPVLATADGKCRGIGAPGPRLGEVTASRFDELEIPFSPGDSLLLFSDGIVEWQGPNEKDYGVRRLHKVLVANTALAPRERLQAIIRDATSFAAGPADDDLSLVLLSRAPSR